MKVITEIKLAKPAHRALAAAGIKTLKKLSTYSESEIASLHGIGDNALKQLRKELSDAGLSFSKK